MSLKRAYQACVRKRKTETQNTRGRPITTYADTNINGYMSAYRMQNVKVADKETTETLYKFLCDDFDLIAGDLIVYNSGTYEVIGDPKNTVNRNHHIKVICKKVANIKS
jgi:hypothetical protein